MPVSDPSNQIVQGLWIGGPLSVMEQLSVASFLAQGHTYHLYAYEAVEGLPSGAVLKDANEILPRSAVFQCHGSYAVFADLFRYQLLLDRGGWWADADIIALRAFDFASEYVFASERDLSGRDTVTNCVIKAPAGSELFMRALDICRTTDFERLPWAASGPGIMHALILRSPLCQFVQQADTFCPIDFDMFLKAVLPVGPIGEQSFAVHLWGELWRRMGLDKNANFAPDSIYEVLKSRYLRNSHRA